MAELEAQYRDFRLRHGRRPRAAEVAGMGFAPARNGRGGWFDFVRDMGDPVDGRALATVGDLLRRVERDRSLTPLALEALRRLHDGDPATEDGRAFWAFEPLLSTAGDQMRLTRPDPEGQAAGMLAELAEWRLPTFPGQQAAEAPAPGEASCAVRWPCRARSCWRRCCLRPPAGLPRNPSRSS
ncbi:MAG: hypothetical protein JJU42_01145 [Rhodobacteraceae bacterium]|nr:hypothetical protein [Paracoccaceae bacterium]